MRGICGKLLLSSVLLLWSGYLIARSTEFTKELKKIESGIREGRYYSVLHQCDQQLNTARLSTDEQYKLLTIKSKIYFWQEQLPKFLESAEKAFKLKKQSSPIFKAYFYAQKAAYYHYFILGDSTKKFAHQALDLLHQNWRDRNKIFYPFVYQSYASSLLYRPFEKKFKTIEQNEFYHIIPVLNYLDSALFYSLKTKHLNQEQAIILRSMGNRLMGAVGYSIKHDTTELTNPSFQLNLADRALKNYTRAIDKLSQTETYLRLQILSLKALAYYCTGRSKQGDAVIWPVIQSFSKNPVQQMGDRLQPTLYALQYFTQHLLQKKKIDPRIYQVIRIYKKIIPLYEIYRSENNTEDTYGSSPEGLLAFIYTRLLKSYPKNLRIRSSAVSFALNEYLFYSKTANKSTPISSRLSFEKMAEKIEKDNLNKRESKLFFIDQKQGPSYVAKLRRQLKSGEALMFTSQGMLNHGTHFLITRKNLLVDTGYLIIQYDPNSLHNRSFSEFKKSAFNNWKSLPFCEEIKRLQIKKLYITIDADFPVDEMITDTVGNNFGALHYFKKNVNVVNVYNPIDFFDGKNTKFIHRYSNAALLNKNSAHRLPYTNVLLEKWSNHPTLSCFKYSNMRNKGILHILGHGKILGKEAINWPSSDAQSKEFKSLVKYPVKSDLIVLNFCFAAFKRITFLHDRDLHNYLISKGAKAVIASPYETVDQSSAYIFEKFYLYLDKGETAEDALQQAKLDYLKTHHGSLAHPMYWSTYELTSNDKDLRLAPKPNRIFWDWVPMLIFLIGVSGSLVWIAVKSRQDVK